MWMNSRWMNSHRGHRETVFAQPPPLTRRKDLSSYEKSLCSLRPLCALWLTALSGRRARDLRDDGGQDKEEQGIRRDLKIEIEQAVDEQCEHPARSPQSRPGHNATFVAGRSHGITRHQKNKPQRNNGAEYPGVGHDLQVIVMSLAD